MIRASFTVRAKNGINYDANVLAITRKCHHDPNQPGDVSVLSFICSGEQMDSNEPAPVAQTERSNGLRRPRVPVRIRPGVMTERLRQ